MLKFKIFCLLISLSLINCITCDLICGSEDQPAHLTEDEGQITILTNSTLCIFKSRNDDTFVALKLDDLKLEPGDSLSVSSDGYPKRTYEPPFDSGYIVTGFPEPKFTISFNNLRNSSFQLSYLEKPPLKLNAENNIHIHIIPVDCNKTSIQFSTKQLIHLETSNAKLGGLSLKHQLLNSGNSTVDVNFGDDGYMVTELKTSGVLANCSGFHEILPENNTQIIGPNPNAVNQYKCVNIFSLTKPSGHLEADFVNFNGLSDTVDVLILDDGQETLKIDSSNEKSFRNADRYLFRAKNLAVIYDSPHKNQQGQQFNLSVIATNYGGFVDAGPLQFPPKLNQPTRIRFILPPNSSFAAQKLDPIDLKPTNLSVKLLENGKQLGVFSRFLPPKLAANSPQSRLVLDFVGNDFSALQNWRVGPSQGCYQMVPDDTYITSDTKSCFIVVSSTTEKKFELLQSSYLSGLSLELVSLADSTVLYKNFTNGPVPKFSVTQMFVNIAHDNKSDVEAVISPPVKTFSVSNQTITSPGYPKWYPITLGNQTLRLAKNVSNYLTIPEIDLRNGEFLKIGNKTFSNLYNYTLEGDISVPESGLNITLVRYNNIDFTDRKGFRLDATKFDAIYEADTKTNKINVIKPVNQNSTILVKIRSQTQKTPSKTFSGKLISFTIPTSKPAPQLTVHDSRSILGRKLVGNSSTSDTLLFVFQSLASNITIEYQFNNCNSTIDHVCDGGTRCVPLDQMCQGIFYCDDGSDMSHSCGGLQPPKIIETRTGISGTSVFFLCLFMLTMGVIGALYGPDMYRSAESRFRSYSTFSSVE